MKELLTDQNIRIEYFPCLNYSMSINGKQCVESFEIYNDDDEDWRDLTVTVDGEMVQTAVAHVDLIERGMTIRVEG